MALTVINGPVIEAGQSLSDGVDISAGPLVRITFPAGWTNANLTFAISSDGNGYNDIYDVHGDPVTITVRPGGAVRVPIEWSTMLGWLKLRSGTPEHPVEQEERREFSVAIETSAAG
jgi:hypothetical protein